MGMALARLATEGFPIACEGDVDGAFSCMVGKMLGCGAVYLSDWLEHDKNTLTLWHVEWPHSSLARRSELLLDPAFQDTSTIRCQDAWMPLSRLVWMSPYSGCG